MIARLPSKAEKLAAEIAADPKERAMLAKITRIKGARPQRFAPMLKEIQPIVVDCENTMKGLRARVELLEHRLDKAEKENRELAAELRTLANVLATKEAA